MILSVSTHSCGSAPAHCSQARSQAWVFSLPGCKRSKRFRFLCEVSLFFSIGDWLTQILGFVFFFLLILWVKLLDQGGCSVSGSGYRTLKKDIHHEWGGDTKFHKKAWLPFSWVAIGIFYLMVMWMLCGWKTWILWWMTTSCWHWPMVSAFGFKRTVLCSLRQVVMKSNF